MTDSALARRVLDLPMPDGNDAEAATVRDYLTKLLTLVWTENECFNGKRPFGNSGWDGDFDLALIGAGLVEGAIDEDGYVEEVDSEAVNRLVLAAIAELGRIEATA